jgi:DMSO reductase family type II enzyme heme b subunit
MWQKIEPQYIGLTQPVIETKRKFVQLIDNIWVKTIFNDQEIAWYLEWDDRNKSMAGNGGAKRADLNEEVRAYSDDPGFNDEIGILFWNDAKNLLDVWKWESDGVVKAYTAEGAIAQGVSLEERSKHDLKVVYTNFNAGQWRVIITRPLNARKKYDIQFDVNKPIQTDFFAWDGHNGDHGLNYPKWEARYKTILVTDETNPD